jgi:hypothetical protein
MDHENIILRYAIALNNISITLFHRGYEKDAMKIIQQSCQAMKIIIATTATTAEKEEDVNDELDRIFVLSEVDVIWVRKEYDLANRLFATSESC